MKPRRILNQPALITQSFAVTAAALLIGNAAQAADGRWTNASTNSTWSTAGNWSGGTVANDTDFTADFGSINIFSNRTVTLNSSRMIGHLIFGDTSGSNTWTLAQSGGSVLMLDTTAGTPTIRVNNYTTTISLELAGDDGMTKEGGGTLILTGANSYTGTTTVNAGTLTLGSGGLLSSGSALAVGGGGIFNFSGAAAVTQTVNGLNVNAGYGTVNNTVSGTTLTLGGITRSGGGMVGFGTTTGNINTSTANNASGIIGTWAFIGTGTGLDYAVSNGAGVAISSLGAATALPDAGPGVAANHYTLAAAQTQTADTIGNTLRYTGAANTLALGTTSLGLNGLLNAGTGTLTITGTAGNPGLVTTGELDIASNGQATTISSVISGAGSVVYGGSGTLTLSGVNSYSGGTFINSGVLFAKNSSALGNTSGAATIASGGRLQLQSVNIANAVNLNGGNALRADGSGNNTLSGVVTLQSNSGWSANNNGNNTTNFSNTLALDAYVFSVSTGGTNNNATISGTLTGGATSGITKTGNGPLTMSGNGSGYSGKTTLSAGELYLGSDTALGTGTFAITPPNDGSITFRSDSSTDRTIAAAITLPQSTNNGNNGRFIFGSASTGNLTFTNTTAIPLGSATRRFEVYNRTEFDAEFTGSSGITLQTGNGTLVLNGDSTYTGATTVTAGTLLVNGSLGSSSAVSITGGTLGGTGTVGGTTTIASGGTFAPGNSIGTMGFSQTLTLDGISNFEIDPTLGLGLNADLADVTGGVTYGGTLNVIYGGLGSDFGNGMIFNLFDADSFTGAFAAVNLPTLAGGLTWQNDLATNGSITVVPEPNVAAVLLGSVGMLCLLRRRG